MAHLFHIGHYKPPPLPPLRLQELHQFFPRLLSNIFGFDHSSGWGLRLFNKTQHGDFHQLLQFMAPHGELFGLIGRLDTEGFIYEFPVECLPVYTLAYNG